MRRVVSGERGHVSAGRYAASAECPRDRGPVDGHVEGVSNQDIIQGRLCGVQRQPNAAAGIGAACVPGTGDGGSVDRRR